MSRFLTTVISKITAKETRLWQTYLPSCFRRSTDVWQRLKQRSPQFRRTLLSVSLPLCLFLSFSLTFSVSLSFYIYPLYVESNARCPPMDQHTNTHTNSHTTDSRTQTHTRTHYKGTHTSTHPIQRTCTLKTCHRSTHPNAHKSTAYTRRDARNHQRTPQKQVRCMDAFVKRSTREYHCLQLHGVFN